MNLPIPIDMLAEELACLPDEACVYVNRNTGEVLSVLNSDIGVLEEGDESDGLEWEWSPEDVTKLQEIAEGNDAWVSLPDKFEINEWEIMAAFSREQVEPLASTLSRAICGRGAFRAFRSVLDQVGRREDWYEFKHAWVVKLASEALSANGISYKRGRA